MVIPNGGKRFSGLQWWNYRELWKADQYLISPGRYLLWLHSAWRLLITYCWRIQSSVMILLTDHWWNLPFILLFISNIPGILNTIIDHSVVSLMYSILADDDVLTWLMTGRRRPTTLIRRWAYIWNRWYSAEIYNSPIVHSLLLTSLFGSIPWYHSVIHWRRHWLMEGDYW